ncbi:MAG TPA: hypothetical protein VLF89_03980 [Candidatus Saccharimonadales bacterium]|nr:hypothetical protein [Candidatus Saccharimonadales bacterium]
MESENVSKIEDTMHRISSSSSLASITPQRKTISIVIGAASLLILIGISSYYFIHRKSTISNQQARAVDKVFQNVPPATTASLNRSNLSNINMDKTVLHAPDDKKIATFYYKGPIAQRGEGDPIFSDVDIEDKSTNRTLTYHLTGPITYAKDGPIYWSPVDNRIYFTHGTNGIGIYALWSSEVDGIDAKLVSGKTDEGGYTHALVNSAIYGAEALDYSPNGKMIITVRPEYVSNNQSVLWVMSYDGTNSRPIPLQGHYKNITSVKWQLDGKHVSFTEWDGTNRVTYITDLAGTKPVTTTNQ